MRQELIDRIYTITDRTHVYLDEPMSRHTTFKTGGPADVLIDVSASEIPDILSLCSEEGIDVTFLGRGSNVLVGDKGIRGVTIIIGSRMSDISIEGEVITAEAGATLTKAANEALKYSLTGMEFASGIPGSVGGAVLMNAGAYGSEIKDILLDADIYSPDTGRRRMRSDELQLSYRHSILMDQESGSIILSARFALSRGEASDIKAKMQELNDRRSAKQPINMPSAGSTFKRPKDNFAGKLIQEAGLMGYRVGGAAVSDKHAGFIVNTGGATAQDIRELMRIVIDRVRKLSGILLEPEVRLIGEFD